MFINVNPDDYLDAHLKLTFLVKCDIIVELECFSDFLIGGGGKK